jgi:hypothetical protein
MTARYTEEVSIKFARAWLKAYFDGVRVPWGSRCVWVAGLQYISDQPGLYLTAGAGGMCGVWILPKAQTMEAKAS